MIALTAISLLLLFAEIVYLRVGRQKGIAAFPGERSSHAFVTVSGAGIIFPLGIFAVTALFQPRYAVFVAGLTLLSAVSFADDIRPISASRRFAVQCVASVLLLLQTFKPEYPVWLVLLALFCILGIVNAYNFMDGINGITGLYTLSVLGPMIYLNTNENFITPQILYVTLVGTLIFLLFNCRRHAVCFCGDVGSVSLGFILAFALLLLIKSTSEPAYIALLMLYGVDTAATIVRRAMLGRNLATAHRMHAYQLLANELGIPQLAVSAGYAGLQLLITLGLIFLPVSPYLYIALVAIALLVAYVLIVRMVAKKFANS